MSGSGLGCLMRLQSDIGWDCSNLKVWLRREDPLSRWLPRVLLKWLLVGDLSFSSCGHLHRAAWISLWCCDINPRVEWSVKPAWKLQGPLWPSFGNHRSLLPYAIGCLIQCGRRLYKDIGYSQIPWLSGRVSSLGCWLPQVLFWD